MVWFGLINGLRLFTASFGSDDYISSATIIYGTLIPKNRKCFFCLFFMHRL
jgi:hypothetical protein